MTFGRSVGDNSIWGFDVPIVISVDEFQNPDTWGVVVPSSFGENIVMITFQSVFLFIMLFFIINLIQCALLQNSIDCVFFVFVIFSPLPGYRLLRLLTHIYVNL